MSNTLPLETVSRPGEPTDAPPGSPRKIRVLMERASRRESLFHPQDNLKRLFPDRIIEDEEPLEPLPLEEVDVEDDLEDEEEMEPVVIEADLAS